MPKRHWALSGGSQAAATTKDTNQVTGGASRGTSQIFLGRHRALGAFGSGSGRSRKWEAFISGRGVGTPIAFGPGR